MIQIAFESEWVETSDKKTVLGFIYGSTDEALGLAKCEFEKCGIEYDIDADRVVLDSWRDFEGALKK